MAPIHQIFLIDGSKKWPFLVLPEQKSQFYGTKLEKKILDLFNTPRYRCETFNILSSECLLVKFNTLSNFNITADIDRLIWSKVNFERLYIDRFFLFCGKSQISQQEHRKDSKTIFSLWNIVQAFYMSVSYGKIREVELWLNLTKPNFHISFPKGRNFSCYSWQRWWLKNLTLAVKKNLESSISFSLLAWSCFRLTFHQR